jgi:hypothetical protein
MISSGDGTLDYLFLWTTRCIRPRADAVVKDRATKNISLILGLLLIIVYNNKMI